MIIPQDANALKYFIKNPSAPKIRNLQKEKLGGDRIFIYHLESSASSIL